MCKIISDVTLQKNDIKPFITELKDKHKTVSLQVDTTYWTTEMFYQLPLLKITVYEVIDGKMKLYTGFPRFTHTYNPSLPSDLSMLAEICKIHSENNLYIRLDPVFDDSAIPAINRLIEMGKGFEEPIKVCPEIFTFDFIIEYF